MVVSALLVNDTHKTTLPFFCMVGNIGNKVGVAAIGFAHDAIFVITEVCGLEPQCIVFFIGMAAFDQRLYGIIYPAIFVECAFQ